MKIRNLILIAVMGLALAGCQNASQPQANQNGKAVVDHGTPYSNGPTTAPDLKGPAAPPPEDGQTTAPYGTAPAAQAVTTNENIRLTLPLKNQ